MKTQIITKEQALLNHLDDDTLTLDDIQEQSYGYEGMFYEVSSEEYMVLTDEELETVTKERILEEVWAFNTWFIIDHLKEGIDIPEEGIKAIQEKYEDGNESILSLIDQDSFVESAISYDGYGHFNSPYDGNHHEVDGYHIFRMN